MFLPTRNPGLIVVDECHETTYKQEQNPKYWSAAVAAKLASLTGARIVLGSATPGLTEAYLAQAGRLELVRLDSRIHGGAHPTTRIIDMRDKTLLGRSKVLSGPLLEALERTWQNGRQSLLFINRRGSATSQSCPDCGWVGLCPHCHLPYSFHADMARLLCHLCGRSAVPTAICPECGSVEIRFQGSGTKKVEAEASRLLPGIRLSRLDRDSATTGHVEDSYQGLRDGSIDLVIGTQMIAKGLDLPGLDTVGILATDSLLAMPDYTASERAFALIVQASGRAGRTLEPGQVFVQTHMPTHPAIVAAAGGDYWAFAASELADRQAMGFPPHRYLARFTATATSEQTAIAAITRFAEHLRQAFPGLELLGPAPAWHSHLGRNYYYQLVAKSSRRSTLVEAAKQLPREITVDLDPLSLL